MKTEMYILRFYLVGQTFSVMFYSDLSGANKKSVFSSLLTNTCTHTHMWEGNEIGPNQMSHRSSVCGCVCWVGERSKFVQCLCAQLNQKLACMHLHCSYEEINTSPVHSWSKREVFTFTQITLVSQLDENWANRTKHISYTIKSFNPVW